MQSHSTKETRDVLGQYHKNSRSCDEHHIKSEVPGNGEKRKASTLQAESNKKWEG